jgi:hypothetical protein
MMNIAIHESNVSRRRAAGARLGYYHFYLLDNEGKVYSAATMYCDDDGDALDRAPFELQRSEWYPAIEVWHGPRFVGRIGHRLSS